MGGVISSTLGLGGGSNSGGAGLNYSATGAGTASLPDIANTATDLTNSAQAALVQQQNLLTALQGQGGIQNQSDVYNQLSNISQGRGPNPAQAMLAQQTGANVANQAALMAGQRGAGANAGLIARQAAQQGAQTQQQAVGQGATLQAQQSLGALGQMGGLATQQVAQQVGATGALNQYTQNEQAAILNAMNQQNVNSTQMQSNINSNNAQISGIAAQGQQNFMGNVMQGIGSAVGLAKGGKVPKYDDGGSVDSQQPSSISPSNIPQTLPGGLQFSQPNMPSTIPSYDPNAPKSKVGQFHSQQNNNSTPNNVINNSAQQPGLSGAGSKIGSLIGQGVNAIGNLFSPDNSNITGGSPMAGGPADAISAGGGEGADIAMLAAKGGRVPAMVSPGEIYLPPKKAQSVAKGKEDPRSGIKIPGEAKVKGDSLKNDTVHADLETGGVVIPRTIALSGDGKKMAKFVAAHLAKSNKKIPGKK